MGRPGPKSHWESVYAERRTVGVSWYRPHLEQSLAFVRQAGLTKEAAIIDVGGGASTFVDDLLVAGYANVTVLDLSSKAIEAAQYRLGSRAQEVHWIVGDITKVQLRPHAYDFWHDRAVFHFLGGNAARRAYVEAARAGVEVGGQVLVATFGPDGPKRCSGLDVVRYDSDGLHAEFGSQFKKVGSATEMHMTPWGIEQQFVYCYCRVMA